MSKECKHEYKEDLIFYSPTGEERGKLFKCTKCPAGYISVNVEQMWKEVREMMAKRLGK